MRRGLSLALLLLAPASASAQLDPCATDLPSRPVGPLQVGELDGNLGVAHRACPREELALGGDLMLVAHTEDFYGNLRINGRGRVSGFLVEDRVEAFVSWEAFRYHSLISAVSASYVGLGYLAWGVSGQVLRSRSGVLAITGRMVLPTTTGLDQGSQPLAADVGMTAAAQLDRVLRIHGWVTLLGSLGVGVGAPEPRAGVRVGFGADWIPFEWLSFVAEAEVGFFYLGLVDAIAIKAGARLALGDTVGLELAGRVPLLGYRAFEDGAYGVAASLMVNVRF